MAGVQTMGTGLTLVKSGDETEDTVIAHATVIGETAIETEEVDVTTLDSPGRAKEYVQGAKDAGTISIETNNCFDGQVAKLKSVFESGTVRDWKVVYPDNKAVLNVKGYIATFTFGEASTDGLATCNFDIRTSGLPTYEEPAATA